MQEATPTGLDSTPGRSGFDQDHMVCTPETWMKSTSRRKCDFFSIPNLFPLLVSHVLMPGREGRLRQRRPGPSSLGVGAPLRGLDPERNPLDPALAKNNQSKSG